PTIPPRAARWPGFRGGDDQARRFRVQRENPARDYRRHGRYLPGHSGHSGRLIPEAAAKTQRNPYSMSDSKALTRPPVALPRTAGRLPRSAGFAAVTAILVLFQAVSGAPARLYVVYQRLWGFSSATLTLIFAIFVFGLLGSLLVLGGLSDFLGRRPVLAASIAAEAAALVVFLLAGSVAALLIARLVQGVATGMVLPALAATLVDFNPPHAPGRAAVVSGVVPIGGLAVGALVCSSLVQYAPDPTHLVWALLLGAMALAFVAVLALPEPSSRQPGAVRSLVPRLGVPHRFR